jgi:hypothetical protein
VESLPKRQKCQSNRDRLITYSSSRRRVTFSLPSPLAWGAAEFNTDCLRLGRGQIGAGLQPKSSLVLRCWERVRRVRGIIPLDCRQVGALLLLLDARGPIQRTKKKHLQALSDRLCELCGDNGEGVGTIAHSKQTKSLLAAARELDLLRQEERSWEEVILGDEELWLGSEHVVSFSEEQERVVKISLPGKFGFVPALRYFPIIDLRDSNPSAVRACIEYATGSPIFYLKRMETVNDVFFDDIELERVVLWPNSAISLVTTQPVYFGRPAEEREIAEWFRKNGWRSLMDRSEPRAHEIYFNPAAKVLAFDALPRNCFVTADGFAPFDVILHPSESEIGEFLGVCR